MAPLHSIPNMIVKHYCGENTERGISWENNTKPEFSFFPPMDLNGLLESFSFIMRKCINLQN